MQINLEKLCDECINIALDAGKFICQFVAENDLEVSHKDDFTPVTLADKLADNLICERLSKLTPDIPVVSEEGKQQDSKERQGWKMLWMIDPLDGTRGFIEGSKQYTVNIALIDRHQPILGVIYSHELDLLYFAHSGCAWREHNGKRNRIKVKNFDPAKPTEVAVSYYSGGSWVDDLSSMLTDINLVRMNSSIKLCYVADGTADIYPRFGPTNEWDTAAGQCIVEAAGGAVVDFRGQKLQYNARNTLLNPSFIVVSDVSQQAYFLERIQSIRREN